MSGPTADRFGLVGRLVDGRYLVERVVGSGGYGVVYRAQHLRLDAAVALKVLRIPTRFAGEQRAQFIERFLQEGKLLFQLGSLHPALVRVLEAGTLTASDGELTPFLAMDWLGGNSLEAELRRMRLGRHRLKLEQAMAVLHPIVEGLSLLHARGIAHRDIKPGNLFLCEEGERLRPKLLDFGLAKIVDAPGAELKTEHRAMTPAYAAPEQWQPSLGPTGPWTDVHALALVIVELLIGVRPLEGDLETACLAAKRPTPDRFGVALAAAPQAVLERALALDPRARPQHARAFWAELAASAGFRPTRGFTFAAHVLGPSPAMARPVDEAAPATQETALSVSLLPQEAAPVGRAGRRGALRALVAGLALSVGLAAVLAGRAPTRANLLRRVAISTRPAQDVTSAAKAESVPAPTSASPPRAVARDPQPATLRPRRKVQQAVEVAPAEVAPVAVPLPASKPVASFPEEPSSAPRAPAKRGADELLGSDALRRRN